MSKHDVFKAKLAHDVIPFGHVPAWQRKAFVKFCVENELIYKPDGWLEYFYKVRHKFTYLTYVSQVRHLPLGKLLEWLADIIHRTDGNEPKNYGPFKGYVQSSFFMIQQRKNNNPPNKLIEASWMDNLLR